MINPTLQTTSLLVAMAFYSLSPNGARGQEVIYKGTGKAVGVNILIEVPLYLVYHTGESEVLSSQYDLLQTINSPNGNGFDYISLSRGVYFLTNSLSSDVFEQNSGGFVTLANSLNCFDNPATSNYAIAVLPTNSSEFLSYNTIPSGMFPINFSPISFEPATVGDATISGLLISKEAGTTADFSTGSVKIVENEPDFTITATTSAGAVYKLHHANEVTLDETTTVAPGNGSGVDLSKGLLLLKVKAGSVSNESNSIYIKSSGIISQSTYVLGATSEISTVNDWEMY